MPANNKGDDVPSKETTGKKPPETAEPFETYLSVAGGEEVEGFEEDHFAPLGAYQAIPMVGLGGSAGSITVLQDFFAGTAANTGTAFVVVVHLSPEHDSTLAAVLQRSTQMRVIQVTQTVRVEPNMVYVIPPGKKLSTLDGHIAVTPLSREPGRRVAVDLFFRTLAATHGPRACGIILSGADSDGSIGIKRIKERGGLTIVQDPDEATFDGMPRAALATRMIDWVLPVREMPLRLKEYWAAEEKIRIPEAMPPMEQAPAETEDEQTLLQILSFLRVNTGRDFSYYKRPTVLRRLFRRMQISGTMDLPSYLSYLRNHPGETGALLQDLLISVTNFFRDHEAFQALEESLPKLFENKGHGDQVRVWVAGCATGEEAYSIAILLSEYAARLSSAPQLQVFATDIDEQAVRAAREGSYPETIAADLSEERLRQFFIHDQGSYRVKAQLRSLVLFAVHDFLSDPPFSRLDLVSCRNLLIYLNRPAQSKAFEIFHFSLGMSGILFLGSSESIDESGVLFGALDKSHRLYLRRPITRQIHSYLPNRGLQALERSRLPRLLQSPLDLTGARNRVESIPDVPARKRELSLAELHFRLLEQVAPPSLVVDQDYNIVHVSENAGKFLQFSSGEPSNNLVRVIHPMLRLDLRAALFRASRGTSPVLLSAVPLDLNGETVSVDISVFSTPSVASDFLMVVFHEKGVIDGPREAVLADRSSAMSDLEKELEHVKGQLHDTVDQYEAGAEELKASNEELQAMNEELRSATEELETSREELQSINEELSTVNQELKGKVDEVSRSNGDLQNLMFSTNIATIFLDRDLRIKRFTPASIALFNLIPSDFGRPLSDLTPKLEYPQISGDARQVLDHLSPVEREIHSLEGNWYLARLLPYRTAEDHIAGVVLTFVDITRRKEAEESLQRSLVETETARSETEAAAAAKDRFLAILSHELRTPLTPVLMTTETLLRREDISSRTREGLEIIRRNVELESHFIDDLLDLTRIARGKFEIVRKNIDLHDVIGDAMEVCKSDLEAKEQQIAFKSNADHHMVSGDSLRLQQVVWNLLKNASKFTQNGGRVEISTRNEDDTIVVTVSDNGKGIDGDTLPHIFEAFSQGGADVTREYGGLGLGLAISKATVETHGGTINVESLGKNKGATFVVTIPLIPFRREIQTS